MRSLDEAVEQLKGHPEQPVTAEVDGMVIELRVTGNPRGRTADDIFREVGRWEGESMEELADRIREARDCGGTKEPPGF